MTYIYHFTHIDNLSSILQAGGLVCDRRCRASNLIPHEIAYVTLKQRRMQTRVEIEPGSTLGDYVPFYFGPRSPMLYAYQQGAVTGSKESADPIIYFISRAETVAQAGIPFIFTDGHPVKEPKAFFNDLRHLSEVDLALMKETYWYDTDTDPDRKRRRQAEFLVLDRLPWALVEFIATYSDPARCKVEDMLRQRTHRPRCIVRPAYYY